MLLWVVVGMFCWCLLVWWLIVGLQLLLGIGLVLLCLVVLLVVCWYLFVVRFGLFIMVFRDLLLTLLLCFGVYV